MSPYFKGASDGHAYVSVTLNNRAEPFHNSLLGIFDGEIVSEFKAGPGGHYEFVDADGDSVWLRNNERLMLLRGGRTISDTYLPGDGEVTDLKRWGDEMYALVGKPATASRDLFRIPIKEC